MRATRRGFTLLELVFAVMIAATALLGLQATVSGAILAAGDSINQRAARERARAKLEEILAGVVEPESSGELEDLPSFKWSSRVKEELTLGITEYGAGNNKVKVVVLEMTYPVEANGDEGEDGARSGRIVLASVLPPPPEAAAPAAPAPGN
ncbi:MAG: prepilin-type N-terminal cleavage/methylation domain-containing protein [Planctomycetota bacterium]